MNIKDVFIICSVHIAVEEKISLTAGRDGGLQNMEVHGLVKVKVNDEAFGKIKVNVINNDKKGIQLQVSSQNLE